MGLEKTDEPAPRRSSCAGFQSLKLLLHECHVRIGNFACRKCVEDRTSLVDGRRKLRRICANMDL